MNEVFPLKKRIKAATLAQANFELFRCAICHEHMDVHGLRSFVCKNRHTFDFAKQGYVNVTNQSIETKYDRVLFEARRAIILHSQFFQPLHDLLAKYVTKYSLYKLLDAGCGEGSHLEKVSQQINNKGMLTVGLDLAKEGVKLATQHEQKLWLVGDLVNMPFNDDSFDCILSILSPANYGEFTRVLNSNGLIIKVVPGTNHLKELRHSLGEKEYSNQEPSQLFTTSLTCVEQRSLTYKKRVNIDELAHLMNMTPLSWKVPQDVRDDFFQSPPTSITIDLEILVGKPHNYT